MRAIIPLTVILMLGLQGCAKIEASKFNPLNWFGAAAPAEALPLFVAPTDDRVLVAQVLEMSVDKTPGGAIIRATGLPPSQGWCHQPALCRPPSSCSRSRARRNTARLSKSWPRRLRSTP